MNRIIVYVLDVKPVPVLYHNPTNDSIGQCSQSAYVTIAVGNNCEDGIVIAGCPAGPEDFASNSIKFIELNFDWKRRVAMSACDIKESSISLRYTHRYYEKFINDERIVEMQAAR